MNESRMTHADADKLLPWLANNTLQPDERRDVQAHLDACAECRENLELLHRMKAAINDPTAIPIVPEARLDDLMDRVDRQEDKKTIIDARYGWVAAASVVLATLAALLFFSAVNDESTPAGQFQTATSADEGNSVAYVLDLTFEAHVTELERRQFLAQVGAREIALDSDSGKHRVVVQLGGTSLDALNRFTAELSDRTELQNVDVVAVQLPVRSEE